MNEKVNVNKDKTTQDKTTQNKTKKKEKRRKKDEMILLSISYNKAQNKKKIFVFFFPFF